MFTERELAALMEDKDVMEAIMQLKKDFIQKGGENTELRNDNFISLVLLAPAVGIALANGHISLFEELSLNKKARRLSQGNYFIKKDPVVHHLQFLIRDFAIWEDQFYQLIRLAIFSSLKQNPLLMQSISQSESTTNNYKLDLLNGPYLLVKVLAFLFTEEEDDLLNTRSISRIEFEKILEIGHKLGLDTMPVFHAFCKTFVVR